MIFGHNWGKIPLAEPQQLTFKNREWTRLEL